MLTFHNVGLYGIEGMSEGALVLRGDHIIVKEGLEGLGVFSLKHHFALFPIMLGVALCVWTNVQCFEEVHHSCIKDLPLPTWFGTLSENFGASQEGVLLFEGIDDVDVGGLVMKVFKRGLLVSVGSEKGVSSLQVVLERG